MNKLTKDQLDMINRLQPFFKEKMGGWLEGDMFYSYQFNRLLYFCSGCHNVDILRARNDKLLCIPKVFDWGQPQRSLWCMVDWTKFYLEESHGTVDVHKNTDEILCMEADPFTALLKILCEQEGV